MDFRYRKRPVVVEAWQSFDRCGEETTAYPRWIMEAVFSGVIFVENGVTKIKTSEGVMSASDGDWIIKGVKGELYPCKPDVFEETYDRVV